MSTDWWRRHLGEQPEPAPREEPIRAWWAPSQPAPPALPAQPAPPAPGPAQYPAPTPAPTRHLQHPQATGRCPQCGSDSYMRPTPTTKPRCYACGWPVVHSTSGASIPAGTPVAGAARQLEASRVGDFRPQHIVGRVTAKSGD
jgi:ribosomal protein L37E